MAQLACYDHLGNLYVVPLKMLSDPGNLVEDVMSGSSGGGEGSSSGSEVARRDNQHKENTAVLSLGGQQEETIIRIRLSNAQKEVTLSVFTQGGAQTITIGQIKARLVEEGAVRSEKRFVRVLFLGRVLEDKERLASVAHFQVGGEGTVLQVLVSDP